MKEGVLVCGSYKLFDESGKRSKQDTCHVETNRQISAPAPRFEVYSGDVAIWLSY